MRHDEAILHLADLEAGNLDPAAAAGLGEHLTSCEECQGLRETARFLASALGSPPGQVAVHLESADIVAYAVGPGDLPTDGLARIAVHLRRCPDCLRDVETVRRAETAARKRSPSPAARILLPGVTGRGPWLPAALAASITFAVLAYPAFLGIRRYPEAVRQARRVAETPGTASGNGPLAVNFLTSPTRGGEAGGPPIFRPAGPEVPITIDLDPKSVVEGPDLYRFEILSGDATRWSWQLSGSEVRSYLDSPQGSVIFTIPSRLLPPGEYVFRVVPVATPQGPPLLEAAFGIGS